MSEQGQDNWVEREMATLKMSDKRLADRTRKIIGDMSENPTGSIPEFCENRSVTQATYNYFSNHASDREAVFQAHRASTIERIKAGGYKRILNLQDTTEYNFNSHPATTDLGPLDNAKVQGFFVHSSLAVSEAGLPLGLLAQQVWVRKADSPKGSDRPIDQKESYKWLLGLDQSSAGFPSEIELVQVSDQESDIYEYMTHPRADNVQLLLRAYHQRGAMDEVGDVRSILRVAPVRGQIEVEVTRRPKQPARTAICQVSFKSFKLRPPQKRPGLPADLKPIKVWAILVREMSPPDGVDPLEWLLLTTLAVRNFEQAYQIIEYYTRRWLIERFHFVIKSGCALEDRQLRKAERLFRFLGIAQIVAWRLLWLTYLGRSQPDLPCTVALTADEWQALYIFIHKAPPLPDEPPSLGQAVAWIAQLGGFLARKSDGHPGVKVLWRGWRRLVDIVQSYLIFHPS